MAFNASRRRAPFAVADAIRFQKCLQRRLTPPPSPPPASRSFRFVCSHQANRDVFMGVVGRQIARRDMVHAPKHRCRPSAHMNHTNCSYCRAVHPFLLLNVLLVTPCPCSLSPRSIGRPEYVRLVKSVIKLREKLAPEVAPTLELWEFDVCTNARLNTDDTFGFASVRSPPPPHAAPQGDSELLHAGLRNRCCGCGCGSYAVSRRGRSSQWCGSSWRAGCRSRLAVGTCKVTCNCRRMFAGPCKREPAAACKHVCRRLLVRRELDGGWGVGSRDS